MGPLMIVFGNALVPIYGQRLKLAFVCEFVGALVFEYKCMRQKTKPFEQTKISDFTQLNAPNMTDLQLTKE